MTEARPGWRQGRFGDRATEMEGEGAAAAVVVGIRAGTSGWRGAVSVCWWWRLPEDAAKRTLFNLTHSCITGTSTLAFTITMENTLTWKTL